MLRPRILISAVVHSLQRECAIDLSPIVEGGLYAGTPTLRPHFCRSTHRTNPTTQAPTHAHTAIHTRLTFMNVSTVVPLGDGMCNRMLMSLQRLKPRPMPAPQSPRS